MTSRLLIAILSLISFLGLSGTGAPQSEEKVGNLTLVVGKGWSRESRGLSAVFRPEGVDKAAICQITVTDGLTASGDIKSWAEKLWEGERGTRKEVVRNDVPPTKDERGMEAVGISAVLQIGTTPKMYHVFIAFRRDGRGGTFSFVTNREDYVTRFGDDVNSMAGSIKFIGAPTKTSTPSDVGKPSKTAANPIADKDPTVNSKDVNFEWPRKLPDPLAVPPGDAEATARYLAGKVASGGSDALPALISALVQAGYSIHNSGGQILISAPPTRSNGLSILDFDICLAEAMHRSRITVDGRELEALLKRLKGAQAVDFTNLWESSVNLSSISKKPTLRFWARFIEALAVADQDYSSPSLSEFDRLSGIQSLFLLTYTAGQFAVERKRKDAEPDDTALDDGDSTNLTSDAQRDGIRNIQELTDALGGEGASLEWDRMIGNLDLGSTLGIQRAQYVIAIAQLQWLNYGTRIRVNAPKLVRTKSIGQKGGDSRVEIDCKFQMDRSIREYLGNAAQSAGAQFSMPADGPVGFASVYAPAWDGRLINPKAGISPFADHVGGGRYHLDFEGAIQTRNLGPAPSPVELEAEFTIQYFYPPEVIQAIFNRFTRIVATSEPTANRTGSLNCRNYTMPVQDWTDGSWIGAASGEIRGSGSNMFDDGNNSWTKSWSTRRKFAIDIVTDSADDDPAISAFRRTNPSAFGERKYRSYIQRRPSENTFSVFKEKYFFDGEGGPECDPKDGRSASIRRDTYTLRLPDNPGEQASLSTFGHTVQQEYFVNASGSQTVGETNLGVSLPAYPVKEVHVSTTRGGTGQSNNSARTPNRETISKKTVTGFLSRLILKGRMPESLQPLQIRYPQVLSRNSSGLPTSLLFSMPIEATSEFDKTFLASGKISVQVSFAEDSSTGIHRLSRMSLVGLEAQISTLRRIDALTRQKP